MLKGSEHTLRQRCTVCLKEECEEKILGIRILYRRKARYMGREIMPFSSPMFFVESLIAFFILYFPLESKELRDFERVLSLDLTSTGHT